MRYTSSIGANGVRVEFRSSCRKFFPLPGMWHTREAH
jgi:hypothetical protein